MLAKFKNIAIKLFSHFAHPLNIVINIGDIKRLNKTPTQEIIFE